jgi:hypothetical protein
VTAKLPFTVASVARAVKGVEAAGRFVVGIAPNGTLLVSDKPLDLSSLVPPTIDTSPPKPSKWEDKAA